MEVQRIEQICSVVRDGLDVPGVADDALEAHLRACHVTPVDIAEALDDVGRLGDGWHEATSLLQFALARLARTQPC